MNDAASVLRRFGLGEADRLGEGGQSIVYALGERQVLRLPRGSAFDVAEVRRQQEFLATIEGRLPFATPVIEHIDGSGSHVIERRLPGRSMAAVLPALDPAERRAAWLHFLEGAEAISGIELPDRPFGQAIAAAPMIAATWHAYLSGSLASFASRNRDTIAREIGDPPSLFAKAEALLGLVVPEPPKALVHGDYFPGNVLMTDRGDVSAVIDFSAFTVVGDPVLDLACACIFLEMNDPATPEDIAFVNRLALERHGPAICGPFRFYRAYFAFFLADPAYADPPYPHLYAWSLANLATLRDGRL